MGRLTDRHDMTITVDWDVNPQNTKIFFDGTKDKMFLTIQFQYLLYTN